MIDKKFDRVTVDELLRDDADCPVFGFNLACAYPFPEDAARLYRPIAQLLAALDPAAYVYPDWETHVTIMTFVNFALHRRPDANQIEFLQSLIPPVVKILQKALTGGSFPLLVGAPVLTPKAAILPISDPTGSVTKIRQTVIKALEAKPELHRPLSCAGLNVPGIVHSTIMRFKAEPSNLELFAANFEKIAHSMNPFEIVIKELVLTTETKPYMREGAVAHCFPLAGH